MRELTSNKGKYWDIGVTLVDGCTKKSLGCQFCWSEAVSARFKRVPELITDSGKFNGKIRVNPHLLKRFNQKKPTRFAIWNDLFHEDVPDAFINDAWDTMLINDRHTYQILTKRPERMKLWIEKHIYGQCQKDMKNILLGVSE